MKNELEVRTKRFALKWLELLLESRHAKETAIESLLAESRELLAIFVASGKTAKPRR